jgi:hypothetical protein
MGGVAKRTGNLIKPKTRHINDPVIKKQSDALDAALERNAKKGNVGAAKTLAERNAKKKAKEDAQALLNKRKGRRKTIKTSSTGLNEDEETLKKTLLGG